MYSEERNPFFDVRKEEVRTESGILLDKMALINDDTDDVVGIVSPTYDVVENVVVDELFKNAFGNLEIKEVHDHMDSVTRRWRRRFIFAEDSLAFEVTPGDTIQMMLEVFNGYDGRTSYGYELMGFREVCENGMVMGKHSLFKETYGHYSENIEQLRESFEMKFDAFAQNIDTWKEWTQLSFPESTFKAFIESRKYLGDKVKEAVVDSYAPLLNEQKLDDTKYGAFNVLTYISTHETKARKGSNLFSARHKNINRAASDLYTYDGTSLVEV
jgi:hypothetical protein